MSRFIVPFRRIHTTAIVRFGYLDNSPVIKECERIGAEIEEEKRLSKLGIRKEIPKPAPESGNMLTPEGKKVQPPVNDNKTMDYGSTGSDKRGSTASGFSSLWNSMTNNPRYFTTFNHKYYRSFSSESGIFDSSVKQQPNKLEKEKENNCDAEVKQNKNKAMSSSSAKGSIPGPSTWTGTNKDDLDHDRTSAVTTNQIWEEDGGRHLDEHTNPRDSRLSGHNQK